MIRQIRKVDGGYILEDNCGERVFKTFAEVVQWLARHFDETRIGIEWSPNGYALTCWHCGGDPTAFEVFDCMDATCHLCHAPFDKNRCAEFKFTPKKRLERP